MDMPRLFHVLRGSSSPELAERRGRLAEELERNKAAIRRLHRHVEAARKDQAQVKPPAALRKLAAI